MKHLDIELQNLIPSKKYNISISNGDGVIDMKGWDGVAIGSSQNILMSGTGLQTAFAEMLNGAFIDASLTRTIFNPNTIGTRAFDQFGYEVAINDTKYIVSALGEDDPESFAGAIYVFDRATGDQEVTIKNPNSHGASFNDGFGNKIAINNTHIYVGAKYETSASGSGSGVVYVFDLDGNLINTITNPNAQGTSDTDYFGSSLDVSNTHIIVGAPFESGSSGDSGSGYVYVFDAVGNLLYSIENPNEYGTPANDNFGVDVAISDSYFVAGAASEDHADGSTSGVAYVFTLNDGNLLHSIINPNTFNTPNLDNFGFGLDMNDSFLAIGAYREDSATESQAGIVYIFDPASGAPIRNIENPNAYGTAANDTFGEFIHVDDIYMIVGVVDEDDSSGVSSGKAYIFNLSDGSLIKTLDNPNPHGTSEGDDFGCSVCIQGNNAIVGARYEFFGADDKSGYAYVYTLT